MDFLDIMRRRKSCRAYLADKPVAREDLLKIVGRVYAGHAVTAPGRLVKLIKEAAAVTT